MNYKMNYIDRFWYSFDNRLDSGTRFIWFLVYIGIPFSVLIGWHFLFGMGYACVLIASRQWSHYKFERIRLTVIRGKEK